MRTGKNWDITDEEFEKLSVQDLQFIFSQSEKLLAENLKSLELLLTRANYIAGALIALATLFIGLVLAQWNSKKMIDHFVLIFGICTLYLIFILIRLVSTFKPTKVYYNGSKPKDMLVRNLFDSYYDKENARLKELIWVEVKSYESRIEFMHELSESQSKEFNKMIYLLYYFPLLILCVSILDYTLHKFF